MVNSILSETEKLTGAERDYGRQWRVLKGLIHSEQSCPRYTIGLPRALFLGVLLRLKACLLIHPKIVGHDWDMDLRPWHCRCVGWICHDGCCRGDTVMVYVSKEGGSETYS